MASEAGTWQADHGDPEWVAHCLDMSLQAYQSSFWRPWRDGRGGDRWMDDATMARLPAAGVRRDLTLEPGTRAVATIHPDMPATGQLPDCRQVQPGPFRPSTRDFRRSARSGEESHENLWSLPLTSGNIDAMLPGWKRLARRVRFGTKRDRPLHLYGRWPPGTFWDSVEAGLGQGRRHLAFALRSDMPASVRWMGAIERNFAALAKHRIARRLVFTTPKGALDVLGVSSGYGRDTSEGLDGEAA